MYSKSIWIHKHCFPKYLHELGSFLKWTTNTKFCEKWHVWMWNKILGTSQRTNFTSYETALFLPFFRRCSIFSKWCMHLFSLILDLRYFDIYGLSKIEQTSTFYKKWFADIETKNVVHNCIYKFVFYGYQMVLHHNLNYFQTKIEDFFVIQKKLIDMIINSDQLIYIYFRINLNNKYLYIYNLYF